jgi:DNA-binding ferritin-like protein
MSFFTRKQRKNGGTRKNRKSSQKGGKKHINGKLTNRNKSHMVAVFLEILNMVKLFHWKTHSYSQHKATDELYARLNEHIDKFIEVLLGKDESRIHMMEKKIELIDPSQTSDFKHRIYEYRTFLTEFNTVFDEKHDSDLLSIRDEILSDVNQFLYLLTFNK